MPFLAVAGALVGFLKLLGQWGSELHGLEGKRSRSIVDDWAPFALALAHGDGQHRHRSDEGPKCLGKQKQVGDAADPGDGGER